MIQVVIRREETTRQQLAEAVTEVGLVVIVVAVFVVVVVVVVVFVVVFVVVYCFLSFLLMMIFQLTHRQLYCQIILFCQMKKEQSRAAALEALLEEERKSHKVFFILISWTGVQW